MICCKNKELGFVKSLKNMDNYSLEEILDSLKFDYRTTEYETLFNSQIDKYFF